MTSKLFTDGICFWLVCLSSLGCIGSTNGQVNPLKIDGPREVRAGDLVRLEAQLDESESPFWIVLEPIDLDYEQVNNGSRLIFAVKCQQQKPITVMLLAQRVVDGRITTRQLRRTIAIAGEQSPEPVVDVKPEPSFQDSPLFALSMNAWDQLDERAKLKTDLIVKNFELIAGLCETGSIKHTADIWKLLSESNRAALLSEVRLWEPVGVAVQRGFQQLNLPTIQEHIFHLRAIAAAFRSKIK